MALFGGRRDINFIKGINRELIHNIISQQVAFYKFILNKTKVNIYGEASEGKFFKDPVLFNALITVGDQSAPTSDMGVDFEWPMKFAFLRQDLIEANLFPEVGDVMLYNDGYFEVDNVNDVQYIFGKNPDYPNGPNNPLNPGLENFGDSLSVTCMTHYIPSDQMNILKSRL